MLHGPELEDMVSCLDKGTEQKTLSKLQCPVAVPPRRCEVVFLNMYKGEQTLSYALALQTIHLFSPILKGTPISHLPNSLGIVMMFLEHFLVNILNLPRFEHTL